MESGGIGLSLHGSGVPRWGTLGYHGRVIALLLFLAGSFALMGVALLLVGLVFLRKNAGFNRRAVSAAAVVVGHREHLSTATAIHRRVYFPIVRYSTADGQAHEASAPGEADPPALGSVIPLIYDPRQPDQVSFTGPRGGGGVAVGLAGVGCALIVVALLCTAAAAGALFL